MIRPTDALATSSSLAAGRFSRSTGPQTWSRYVVSCPGFVRARLGEIEFERQIQRRRNWCRDNCLEDFTIDILLSSVEFSFEDEEDARQFRFSFC
jgi:hypothetical protein